MSQVFCAVNATVYELIAADGAIDAEVHEKVAKAVQHLNSVRPVKLVLFLTEFLCGTFHRHLSIYCTTSSARYCDAGLWTSSVNIVAITRVMRGILKSELAN